MEGDNSNSRRCITCLVAFQNDEAFKLHYKGEWHRYNLCRKVENYPPITAQEFQKKINDLKIANTIKEDEKQYCAACKKTFQNLNSYENHTASKKHIENANKVPSAEAVIKQEEQSSEAPSSTIESEMDVDDDSLFVEVDSDEWDEDVENPIDDDNCIFCLHHSNDFDENLEHMTTYHSFFIPDSEYCIDVPGLLRYLGEKISAGFICIWCNERGRTFHSAEAARNHMIDKCHCRMIFEGPALAEYSDFYDYSSSYPDADEHDDSEEAPPCELDDTGYQLILPSGIKVGHRSLLRYYKQRAKTGSAVAVPKKERKLHKDLAYYRSLGWTQTDMDSAARRAKDIHYLKRMQAKFNLKVGMKGNKLQKNFRKQVNY